MRKTFITPTGDHNIPASCKVFSWYQQYSCDTGECYRKSNEYKI